MIRHSCAADLSVTAALDPASVYLGESGEYRITVAGSNSEPQSQFPAVDGINASYQGTSHSASSNITIINGKMTQQSSVTFVMTWRLTPARGGSFAIPPVTVSAGGQTAQTPALTLNAASPSADERVILEVAVSPNPVVVGREFTVTFRLFIQRLAYEGRQIDADPFLNRDPPALKIPWFESLPNTETRDFRSYISGYVGNPGFTINQYARDEFFSRRLITFRPPRKAVSRGGRDYFVYTVEKTFKAVSSGEIALEPCVIKGKIFDQMVGPDQATQRDVYQISNGVTLRITEPPAAGRPSEWSGAIGAYSIEATAEPVRINLGDPITLTLTVKGSGLWNTVTAPDLSKQDDFQAAFKIHDKDVPGEQRGDVKVFKYTIRPAQSDLAAIPPVRFAFFNPAKNVYAAVKSDPIPVEIRSAGKVGLDEIVESRQTAAPSAAIQEMVEGLYANRTDPGSVLAQSGAAAPWSWPALILAPVLFALAGGVTAWRNRLDPRVERSRRAHAEFRDAVRRLDTAAGSDSDFISGMLAAAAGYVAGKLWVAGSSLTPADIDRRLTERAIPAELRARLRNFLDGLERHHYSGSSGTLDRGQMVADLSRIIGELEKTFGESRSTRFWIALLVVTLVARAAAAERTHAEADRLLVDANADMEAVVSARTFEQAEPRLRAAIGRYRRLIENGYRSGHLYYNLGNCHLRLREVGEAVYWLRMAERALPADGQVRANLRFARTQTRVKFPPPPAGELIRTLFVFHHMVPFGVRRVIFLLFWNLFWLLLTARLFAAPLRRRWLAVMIFLPALVFGSSIAADLARHRMNVEAVIVRDEVIARKGAAATFDPAFNEPLSPGIEVSVLQIKPPYAEVRFTNNTAGWIPVSSLKILSREPEL